jgi:enamine deaminase RidA (YjgF/YER057c/UK114 family)
MRSVVEAAGGTFANIVKVTIYITDINYRQSLDRVRSAYYGSNFSTSTLVVVAGLGKRLSLRGRVNRGVWMDFMLIDYWICGRHIRSFGVIVISRLIN